MMGGERIQIPIKLKAGHHRSASETLLKCGVLLEDLQWPNIECLLGSFLIFLGFRTSIAKKPCSFVIFQGGPDPLSPLLVRA